MGTINYGTSNYITIGIEPYDASDFEKDIDGGGANLYYFYVQYFVEGKEYLLKSKHTSRPKKIGKSITVKYNSKQPEEAIIVGKSVYVGALIFIYFIS